MYDYIIGGLESPLVDIPDKCLLPTPDAVGLGSVAVIVIAFTMAIFLVSQNSSSWFRILPHC